MTKVFLVLAALSVSATPAFASSAGECIKKVDAARTSLLAFKDGKGDEATVHQTAKDVSACLDGMDAKGKQAKKDEAISAWKAFRAIREEKLVPAIKGGNKAEADKLASDNKANLERAKNALNSISGD